MTLKTACEIAFSISIGLAIVSFFNGLLAWLEGSTVAVIISGICFVIALICAKINYTSLNRV